MPERSGASRERSSLRIIYCPIRASLCVAISHPLIYSSAARLSSLRCRSEWISARTAPRPRIALDLRWLCSVTLLGANDVKCSVAITLDYWRYETFKALQLATRPPIERFKFGVAHRRTGMRVKAKVRHLHCDIII